MTKSEADKAIRKLLEEPDELFASYYGFYRPSQEDGSGQNSKADDSELVSIRIEVWKALSGADSSGSSNPHREESPFMAKVLNADTGALLDCSNNYSEASGAIEGLHLHAKLFLR